jgi:hypothetical protein
MGVARVRERYGDGGEKLGRVGHSRFCWYCGDFPRSGMRSAWSLWVVSNPQLIPRNPHVGTS